MVKNIKVILRLLRIENLFIIALTQYLTRFFIIKPLFEFSGITLNLNETEFLMIVIATLLIASAGYFINDYFDIGIDRINRPNKVIVGTTIKRKTIIFLHFLLNSIAMLFIIAITYKIKNIYFALIFFISTILLWLYSAYFKRMFLTGNIVVSLLLAFVIIVAWIPEYILLLSNNNMESSRNIVAIINLQVIFYSFFALVVSFIRELIKDIEDYKGDKIFGCRTFPVVAGIENARTLAFVLSLTLTLLLIAFAIFFFTQNRYIMFVYILIFLSTPTIFATYLIKKINEGNNISSKISLLYKIIILLGVISMVFINTN